jgi:uncharacterized protein YnzC (UPF0291/DUF896 family)
MSTDRSKTSSFGKNAVDSEMFTKAIDALDGLEADQEAVELEHFRKLYPSILRAMAQGHSVTNILKTLDRAGFNIHPAKFKKLKKKLETAEAGDAAQLNDAADRGGQ